MMPTVVNREIAPHVHNIAPTMRSDVRREAAPDKSNMTGSEPPNAVSGAIPCSIDGASVPAMRPPGFVPNALFGSSRFVSRKLLARRSWFTDPGIVPFLERPPGDARPREVPLCCQVADRGRLRSRSCRRCRRAVGRPLAGGIRLEAALVLGIGLIR